MDRLRTFVSARGFAAAMILQTLSPFSAVAIDDRAGWAYCAPPYPPKCIASKAKGHAADALCERDVDSYVDAVFRYRICLATEMERAVREANRTVQIIKCPKDKRYCYGLPATESR